MQTRLRQFGFAALAAAVLAGAIAAGRVGQRWVDDARISNAIASGSVEARKQAAWRLADRGVWAPACDQMAAALADPDPNAAIDEHVREAYAYALGQIRDPRATDALLHTVQSDASGFVRQAAWVALARVAPRTFEQQAAAATDNDWDELGRLCGRMELRDFAAAGQLVDLARSDQVWLREVAKRAVAKWLGPTLDAAGLLPIGLAETRPEAWSSEDVAALARRVNWIDLPAAARATEQQLAAARDVRRTMGKLITARERLARLLTLALGDQKGKL